MKLTVGIVDYAVGNHSSILHTLQKLGYRCRVSYDLAILEASDLLLLPGVGSFRPAMMALHEKALDIFLIDWARKQKPILGICLGMQLLTKASYEGGYTAGLGLIPGSIVPLDSPRWHIGWNSIELHKIDSIFAPSHGENFYFNHSYAYEGPEEFKVCITHAGSTFASVIRFNLSVGVQFHPEKSQSAGHAFLRQIIEGLCNA